MKKIKLSAIIVIITVSLALCSISAAGGDNKCAGPENPGPAKLLINLPDDCNTPDGATLDANGNIILSMPNFNNGALLES